MMEYEIFKDVVKEKFLSYMPEKYQDMEVRVDSVEKVNRRMDGLSVWKAGREKTLFPTIYINDMYENYLKSGDLQAVLQDAAEAMDRAAMQGLQNLSLDMAAAKDNIIFQLVNTMQNEDMLKNLPHRDFQDLSIIYRWVADVGDRGIVSMVINHNIEMVFHLLHDFINICIVCIESRTVYIRPITYHFYSDFFKIHFFKKCEKSFL